MAFSSIPASVPAVRALTSKLEAPSYALFRFVTGAFLVPHGAQKLFGAFGGGGLGGTAGFFSRLGLEPSYLLAIIVACVEFFGGILIAVGFLTRPAALLATIVLLVATLLVHLPNGFFAATNGIEFPALWTVALLLVAVYGAGAYSVDASRGREI